MEVLTPRILPIHVSRHYAALAPEWAWTRPLLGPCLIPLYGGKSLVDVGPNRFAESNLAGTPETGASRFGRTLEYVTGAGAVYSNGKDQMQDGASGNIITFELLLRINTGRADYEWATIFTKGGVNVVAVSAEASDVMAVRTFGGNNVATATLTSPVGQWSHVICQWTAGTGVHTWINGVKEITTVTDTSAQTGTDDIAVSRNVVVGARDLDASWAKCAMYKGGLTDAQVQQLYKDPFGHLRDYRHARRRRLGFVAPASTGQLLQIPHHLRAGFNAQHGGFAA